MPQNQHARFKTKKTFSMSQLVYNKGNACNHVTKQFQAFPHFFFKLLFPLAPGLAPGKQRACQSHALSQSDYCTKALCSLMLLQTNTGYFSCILRKWLFHLQPPKASWFGVSWQVFHHEASLGTKPEYPPKAKKQRKSIGLICSLGSSLGIQKRFKKPSA